MAVGEVRNRNRIVDISNRHATDISDGQIESGRIYATPRHPGICPDHIRSTQITASRNICGRQIGAHGISVTQSNQFVAGKIVVAEIHLHGDEPIRRGGLGPRNRHPD